MIRTSSNFTSSHRPADDAHAGRPRRSLRGLSLGAAALALLALQSPSRAAEGEKPPKPPEITAETEQKKVRILGEDGKEVTPPEPTSDVERYCTAIADPARDARSAIQKKRLVDLEAEVSAKIDELEAKRREYQDWLEQRRAFIDSTSSIMMDIYSTMKPDAAAAQLATVDRVTAASVLAKLKSRTASAILTEMPSKVAAEIANVIVQKTNKNLDSAGGAAQAPASPPKQG